MDSFQEVFGWAATVLTIISFLFPIFPYLNVIRGKLSFEDTPAVYVTTCYLNYFCWFVYGDMIYSNQLKVCYLVGSIINCILMVIYIAYEFKKYCIDSILNTLILITGTWALYRALIIIIDDDRIVGKICVGTCFIVYLSPIQIIYKVLKDKNYLIIPIYNCWLIFLYSICWIVYGIYITDNYIIISYSVAITLSLIEIFIYLNYKKKYPSIGEREFSTIGIESSNDEPTKKEEMPIKLTEENEEEIKEKNKPVKILNN